MNYRHFKEKTKWLCLATDGLFLIVNIYLRVKHRFDSTNYFDSANFAGLLTLSACILALATLFFGVISFPRWQSVFALLIFAYALYWALYIPPYAVS
jgi:glucan phosphoethanolaminetransferase (alkaline phosphatase superfamily)